MKTRLCHTLLLWLLTLTAGAQPACTVRTFTLRDGLAANTISGLCQTDDDLMWISTWNGLCCFDGYSFTTFRDVDKPGAGKTETLTSNRLLTVRANSRNDVWCISYDRELYLFDTHHCQFVDVGQQIRRQFHADVDVRTVFPLANGYSWIVNSNGKPSFRIKDATVGSSRLEVEEYKPGGQVVMGSHINKVYLDSGNREWIFTDKGATLLGTGFRSAVVYDYLVQVGQTIVMAAPTGEVGIWQNGWKQERRIGMPEGVTAISELAVIDDYRVVMATNVGIVVCDLKTRQAAVAVATEQELSILRLDSRKRIWAFGKTGGVLLVDAQSWTGRWLSAGPYNPLMSTRSELPFFHEDGFGTVWVVPSDGAFCYYDEAAATLVPYTLQTATAFNPWVFASGQPHTDLPVINKFMTDHQKNLWFTGSRDLTLINFNYRRLGFTTVVPNQEARAVLRDSKGNTWIGMFTGELAMADATGKLAGYLSPQGSLQPSPVKFSDRIYALFEDSRGRLFIGTKGQGLYIRTADGSISHYTHDDADVNSLSHDQVYGFDEDPSGRLWIATYGGGPNILDGDGRFLNHRNSFLRTYPYAHFGKVRRISHSHTGEIFFSTNGGLVVMPEKGGRYHTSTHQPGNPESLLASDVMQTLVTGTNEVYVITMGGGIQYVKDDFSHDNLKMQTVTALAADDGLVQSMVEDGKRNLWVVREATVDRYDPVSGTVETFGPNEFGERTKFTEAQPFCDRKTGDIVLAVLGGSVAFRPSQMQKSAFQPKLLFTGVKYQGSQQVEPVLNTDMLDVPASQRNLTIYFSALDYRDNHQLRYAYAVRKASGSVEDDIKEVADDEWNYVGNAHSASFNHLPHGHLRLLVKSTNSDGVWVDNISVLDINSHPTFWETPWATLLYLLLLAVVVGTGFYIYRLRTRIEMRRELTDMKTRFFTEVEDEDKEMMKKLTTFLDQNISNADLRMEDLADAVNLGRSVFSGKVKSIVGMTPVDFVRHIRIQHAEHLIKNTSQTFSQIAYAVGFSDPKYFSKCFKKETGMTPSEYRKS